MFEPSTDIPQIEIERHMNDYAARVQVVSHGQRRYADMQRLLLKVQNMSDKDFDVALASIETVVETLSKKTPKNKDKESLAQSKQISSLITPTK